MLWFPFQKRSLQVDSTLVTGLQRCQLNFMSTVVLKRLQKNLIKLKNFCFVSKAMHATHLITAVLFIALKSGPYFWSSEYGTWWMCTITAYMPHPKPQILIQGLGSYVNTQEIQFQTWWSYPNPWTVIEHSTDSNTIEIVVCIQSDMWSLAAIWPWSNIVFIFCFWSSRQLRLIDCTESFQIAADEENAAE